MYKQKRVRFPSWPPHAQPDYAPSNLFTNNLDQYPVYYRLIKNKKCHIYVITVVKDGNKSNPPFIPLLTAFILVSLTV